MAIKNNVPPCSSIPEVKVKACDHAMSSSPVLQNVASNYNEEEERDKVWVRVGNAIVTIILFAYTLGVGSYFCSLRVSEKPNDSTIVNIAFAFYLFMDVVCIITALSCTPNDVIKKFALGGDKEEGIIDHEKSYYYVVFHSTGFSAIACCCSLLLSGILLYKLNDVARELAGNCRKVALHTVFSWTFKTCPYSIGVPAFIVMALLFGFRTYNLIARKLKVPVCCVWAFEE
ncbi:hypothetical protein COLO4_21943 [Corchorus olitorius]|uniref:Uncharacterized protein n=1 Tax=Corchorus olitorius TaxID=93759 RepID=A0A1R3IPV9_9ROSI|nr:hypothetical protein COLO4_21943 [Corchorus olitorius]